MADAGVFRARQKAAPRLRRGTIPALHSVKRKRVPLFATSRKPGRSKTNVGTQFAEQAPNNQRETKRGKREEKKKKEEKHTDR